MRRNTIGGVLRDSRGARGRAQAVRDALGADPSGPAVAAVMRIGLAGDLAQMPLWSTASDVVVTKVGWPRAGETTQPRVSRADLRYSVGSTPGALPPHPHQASDGTVA